MTQTLDNFDLKETKKKVTDYFSDLEKLKWEQARLNIQRGLTAKYGVSPEDKKQAYIPFGKDEFALLAKAAKDSELRKHLSGYYWAKSILSEQEQLYITEYFVKGKYEDEIVDLLGFTSSDSRAFRRLKRNAVYKFAYVLSLIS